MITKLIYSFFVSIFSVVCLACGNDVDKHQMASQIMADDDYIQYICGDSYCDQSDLERKIEFRARSLNSDGSMIACFVDPIRKAENYYIGFFVKSDRGVDLQFVYFGSGLDVIEKSSDRKEVYPVEGTEVVEHGLTERSRYEWNGQSYILTDQEQINW